MKVFILSLLLAISTLSVEDSLEGRLKLSDQAEVILFQLHSNHFINVHVSF